ncbi:MAG: triose-phosphate isomerase [Desulfobacteraceae bacterium]|jgi:triosephosphate isomerase|nr:triose-phosphate isomerase [Desulfobacteraceae bacterium]
MPQRIPFIAGNWKMYKTAGEAVQTARDLVARLKALSGVDVMIAPAYPALDAVSRVVKDSPVKLGAQNLFWADEGAYTGEVAGGMLVDLGCRYVLIGHSERRQYFGETDDTVRRRIEAALRHGLAPVMCIGETETQRDAVQTFSVLDKQIANGLKEQLSSRLEALVVAYEPVWAIGTGRTATADQAQEAHRFIRGKLAELFGADMAQRTRIVYGGSVKPENIAELMAMADIDGALVGGASLEAETFANIVRYRAQ